MKIILLTLLVFLITYFVISAYFLILGMFFKTPFFPSKTKDLEEILKYLKLENNIYNFVDIGSGDGRFVFWALKNNFKSATGVEYNPLLYFFSQLRKLIANQKNAKFLMGDFEEIDFSSFNFVYLYLLPRNSKNIYNKLKKELPEGAIVVSKLFRLSEFTLFKEIDDYFIYKV